MIDVRIGDREQFEDVAAAVVELRSRFVSHMRSHARRRLAQIPKTFACNREAYRKLPIGEGRGRRVESAEFVEYRTSDERGRQTQLRERREHLRQFIADVDVVEGELTGPGFDSERSAALVGEVDVRVDDIQRRMMREDVLQPRQVVREKPIVGTQPNDEFAACVRERPVEVRDESDVRFVFEYPHARVGAVSLA